jgi:hypothetical protein
MKKIIKTSLILISILFINTLWADSDNYWTCTVQDNEKHQWITKNAYKRVAINRAMESCKKNSHEPNSCDSTQIPCDYFSNNDVIETPVYKSNTSVTWHCPALDSLANYWVGPASSNRDRAYLNAKTFCHMQSIVPETCYVNLIACSNL